MLIRTRKSDVAWSYIGTVVSMSSGFVLLPFLLRFLTDNELGLWYVLTALANLAMLFEFGFNPTFARNIVYIMGGAQRLTKEGVGTGCAGDNTNWHLLNVVIRASKMIYAGIAVMALVLLATIGTVYIAYITENMDGRVVWLSWAIFVVAIFLNLYFLWTATVLRGYGDVAGQNKATTVAKISQLAVSTVLLLAGAGLLGASIGYLVNSLGMRLVAMFMLRKHHEIEAERKMDVVPVRFDEVKRALSTVAHIAWRDGVVQLALYCSTQAMSILSSLFLGLSETGTYSLLFQLGNAICSFASTYPRSFYPAMQFAFAESDMIQERRYAASGIFAYWSLLILGVVGGCVVVLPLLPLFKPDVSIDYLLFIGLCGYLCLLQQHSIFCNYIINMNEVPYMRGYLAAAILGVSLVGLFCGVLGMGSWGIVLGQALSQIVYNNWKWPKYLCGKIGTTYPRLIQEGWMIWRNRLIS